MERVAEDAFSEEEHFFGMGRRLWVVLEVKHSQHGRCCIGVLDWETVEQRYVAAFASRIEVLNALRARGYLNLRQVFPTAPPDDPQWGKMLELRRTRRPVHDAVERVR